MFSLICAWINGWVNNRETHYSHQTHILHDIFAFSMKCLYTSSDQMFSKLRLYVHPTTTSVYQQRFENVQISIKDTKSTSCNLMFHSHSCVVISYVSVEQKADNIVFDNAFIKHFTVCQTFLAISIEALQEFQFLVTKILKSLSILKLTMVFIWLSIHTKLVWVQFTPIICSVTWTKQVISKVFQNNWQPYHSNT